MNKLSRRLALGCIVMLFVACFLVTGVRAAENATITVLWRSSPVENPMLDRIIAEFHKKHPNIVVKPIIVAYEQYEPKLLSMFAAGSPPDIFWCAGDGGYIDHAVRGMDLDLTPYLKKEPGLVKDFYPAAIQGSTFRGRFLGLSWCEAYTAGFYNATLFDRAGLGYPPTDWADKTWTYDKMVETAQKLTKDLNGDGRVDQFGVIWDLQQIIEDMWMWGGDLFAGEVYEKTGVPEKTALDNPRNRDALFTALQKKADLIHKYKVSPTPAQSQVIEQMGPPLKTGRVGMVFSGNWAITPPLPKDYKWGICAVPLCKQRKVIIYSNPLEIAKTSKHPEAAWEFSKYFVSEEAQRIMVELTPWMPCAASLRKLYIDNMLKHTILNEKQLEQVLKGAFEYAQESPNHTLFGFPKMFNTWNAELEGLWLGKLTVKEAVDALLPKLDRVIQDNLKQKVE
ncbi:MAG: sugar ABC transporter substrate-binding protein [Firmicutes bacterium]|nr:sugar ABC transporter substrate-binding protein [Bacillota bacterium]